MQSFMIRLVHLLCVTEDLATSCRPVSKECNVRFSKQIEFFLFYIANGMDRIAVVFFFPTALLSPLIFLEVTFVIWCRLLQVRSATLVEGVNVDYDSTISTKIADSRGWIMAYKAGLGRTLQCITLLYTLLFRSKIDDQQGRHCHSVQFDKKNWANESGKKLQDRQSTSYLSAMVVFMLQRGTDVAIPILMIMAIFRVTLKDEAVQILKYTQTLNLFEGLCGPHTDSRTLMLAMFDPAWNPVKGKQATPHKKAFNSCAVGRTDEVERHLILDELKVLHTYHPETDSDMHDRLPRRTLVVSALQDQVPMVRYSNADVESDMELLLLLLCAERGVGHWND
ncbi:DNA repair and recombination protein RAD54-like [Taenia solium]|eukprot:TsM_000395000 transcript=TsM_000395000 gene=TsM_000395000